jgi:hypothetical protein
LQNSSIVPCGKYPPLPTTLELRTLLHWRDLLFAKPVGPGLRCNPYRKRRATLLKSPKGL